MTSTTAAAVATNVQRPMRAPAVPAQSAVLPVTRAIPITAPFAVKILQTAPLLRIVHLPVISHVIPIITRMRRVLAVRSIRLPTAAAAIRFARPQPMDRLSARRRELAAIIVTIPVTPIFARALA